MKTVLPDCLSARLTPCVGAFAGVLSAVSSRVIVPAAVAICASPLLAQDEPLRPPRTSEPPSGPKFLVMFVALLLLAGVIFAATLKSKRGHQD